MAAEKIMKLIFWTGLLAVFITALVLLKSILFPFVAGLAIAYFLDPICDKLEAKGLNRTLATSIITGGFFAVLAVAMWLVVPKAYDEFVSLLEALPSYWAELQTRAGALKETPLFGQAVTLWQENNASINSERVISFAVDKLKSLVGGLGGGLGALFNFVSLFLITPIVSFYLLRDWDRLTAYIETLIPKRHHKKIKQLFADMDKALSGYVRGQILVCFILGILLGTALHLINLPYGFIIGFASGLLSFIPYVGQLLGAIVALIVAYVSSQSFILPLSALAVFAGGNILEGFFLTPKFVGKSIGVHAVWIMFALLAGAAMFGFVGVVLALPVAACLSVLVKFGLVEYRKSNFYKK